MIIIYGGAFNPPTKAHYEIANFLINKYNPKQFIYVPVGDYYDKEHIVDFKHRFNMLEILTKNLKNCLISDYEQGLSNFAGSITTLNHFQEIYDDKIYFVVGADHLQTIKNWIDYEEILKRYKIIIMNRNKLNVLEIINNDMSLKGFQSSLLIENDFDSIDISSTNYRNHYNDYMVTYEVNQYINEHNLYDRGILYEQ